jgi:hypothetical protein
MIADKEMTLINSILLQNPTWIEIAVVKLVCN